MIAVLTVALGGAPAAWFWPRAAPTPAVTQTVGTADNTGPSEQASLTLTEGPLRITEDGAVVTGLDLRGPLIIEANDVTVSDSRVTAASPIIVQVGEGAQNVTLERLDIRGPGEQAEGTTGVVGPIRLRSCDITGVENAVIPGSGSVITGNYFHGFAAGGAAHYDGVQLDGGQSDVEISFNTIDLEHSQTAAVMINNYQGAVNDIVVRRNTLVGGSYTIYVDAQFSDVAKITGVEIVGNDIDGADFGPALVRGATVVWSGNQSAATGQGIPLP